MTVGRHRRPRSRAQLRHSQAGTDLGPTASAGDFFGQGWACAAEGDAAVPHELSTAGQRQASIAASPARLRRSKPLVIASATSRVSALDRSRVQAQVNWGDSTFMDGSAEEGKPGPFIPVRVAHDWGRRSSIISQPAHRGMYLGRKIRRGLTDKRSLVYRPGASTLYRGAASRRCRCLTRAPRAKRIIPQGRRAEPINPRVRRLCRFPTRAAP